MHDLGTKEIFPRKLGGRLLKKKPRQLTIRVTEQVFRLFPPAILLSQRELPLQLDWSFQSLQAAA